MNLYQCTCFCGCPTLTTDYVCNECKDGKHLDVRV